MHELKYDGYRTQVHKRGNSVVVHTRRGYDWTPRFKSIADAVALLPADSAVLDGEVIVPDRRGASDYHALQLDLAQGRSDRLVYFAFDLLYLDGYDVRGLPLIERKHMLERLIADRSGPLKVSEYFEVEGPEMFERVCEMRLEGIVSKRKEAPYRSGRNDLWLKTKCIKSDSYPIIAFVEKLGARPRRIASLYVGRRDGDRLVYAGKVRTGYSDEEAREVRELLDPHIRRTSPLSIPIKKPKATWVDPLVDAEVQFSSVTEHGILREAVFKGVREHADTSKASRISTATPPKQPRIRVSRDNILQLLPDAVAPSRDELKAYWQVVGNKALEYLGERPLKLVRNVQGTIYYHRGKLPPTPPAVKTLRIKKREGGEGTRVYVKDVAGLMGLVDMGVVEIHPWNAHVDNIELADLIVMDLDPGEGVAYDFVVQSALRLREILAEEGLRSWPKLTGGKGIHVMTPLERRMQHDKAHAYAKSLADRLAATDRRLFTLSAALATRKGRLFIDYLRNGRGTTAVGTYSPRVRPGFPIAAPVTWAQIEGGIRADAYSINHLPNPTSPRRGSR